MRRCRRGRWLRRCNFTNTGASPGNYLSANPHFCKSALARYTPAHFIELVERHGIGYHEKELGQLFCDESSKLIVKMLLDECTAAGHQDLLADLVRMLDHQHAQAALAGGERAHQAGGASADDYDIDDGSVEGPAGCRARHLRPVASGPCAAPAAR